MQWRTTDETLSHGRTCSLLLVFTLRDKPVVFGSLGRVADGNRELRHAWASSKPPALVLYLATMQSLWLGSRRMCKIKVLPSLPCGLFGVSSKVQMKMYGLLCIFVPGRTKKNPDYLTLLDLHMKERQICERSIYPLCKVNSGRAPRDVSCSSKATIRRPI